MLLAREEASPVSVVERLVAMQAQQPRPPFIGLWTRIAGFRRDSLVELLHQRKLVRATTFRATIHIMTAKDFLAYRSAVQTVWNFGFDPMPMVAAARKQFEQRPHTFAELRTSLLNEFPHLNDRFMGYAARIRLPLVMLPDDSEYAFGADARFALAEHWLKKPVSPEPSVRDLVLRYLAAFGPASPADAQNWSGVRNLKPVFTSLRRKLEVFYDEQGRELFDLPGAPRPHDDTPAPVRLIPGFDNLILGHADRSRIIAGEHRARVVTKNLQVLPTFLVDGFVAGTWDIKVVKRTWTVTISPFRKLPSKVCKALVEESESLVSFVAPSGAPAAVVFTGPL